jgi:hypothetical protein
LDILKNDQRWYKIYQHLRDNYKMYKNPNYAFQLDSLYFSDQIFRTIPSWFKEGKKTVPRRLDTLSEKNAHDLTFLLDKLNLKKLEELLKKYG